MTEEALPRRNLGLSENWGRAVEVRVADIVKKLGAEIQNLDGLGRYTASAAEEFGRNAARIEESLNAIPYQFSLSDYEASPPVTTSWSTILSVSVPVPANKPILEVMAVANSTMAYPSGGPGTTQFSWPFSLSLVTSEYGPRDGGFHEGIDFAGGAAVGGAPIPAAGDGVVADAYYHSGWGNHVRLVHNVDGTMMSTLYAHMVTTPSVSAGQTVTRGQTLGYIGNTGNSFGNHLHFETWTGTTYGTHADPRWFMSMYGEGPSAPPPDPPRLRLRIGGVASIAFSGLVAFAPPIVLTYAPIFGRSFTPTGSVVNIDLEAIAGASLTGYATTLAVTGSFHD